MVRTSDYNDIPQIIAVWNEAFGDSEKEIRFFLNSHYNPQNTLVYECEGLVASVLFLIDGDMHIKGKDYPAYYLYAACTSRKFRGRGFMANLLDFAKSISISREKFFIALKPGEESLYKYYSEFGYKSVFTKKIVEIDDTVKFNSDLNCDTSDFSDLRDKAYNSFDYFKWSKKSVDFAVAHHSYYDGLSFISCKGYSLYTYTDNTIHVKETTFTSVRDLLDTNLKFNKIIIELPCNFNFEINEYKTVNSGMLLPLNDIARELTSSIKNAYLALTLD